MRRYYTLPFFDQIDVCVFRKFPQFKCTTLKKYPKPNTFPNPPLCPQVYSFGNTQADYQFKKLTIIPHTILQKYQKNPPTAATRTPTTKSTLFFIARNFSAPESQEISRTPKNENPPTPKYPTSYVEFPLRRNPGENFLHSFLILLLIFLHSPTFPNRDHFSTKRTHASWKALWTSHAHQIIHGYVLKLFNIALFKTA